MYREHFIIKSHSGDEKRERGLSNDGGKLKVYFYWTRGRLKKKLFFEGPKKHLLRFLSSLLQRKK
jgi:hypothetical protein